ncbi:hypothetical protein QVA66_03880 [Staphylococcus chromogenes]|nr:hypothetical protein [Staphylococcus chromogenes]
MNDKLEYLLSLPAKTPGILRFVIMPILWRTAVIAPFLVKHNELGKHIPLDLSAESTQALTSSMFTGVASVLGVLAGFIVTSLTIVMAAQGSALEEMKQAAPRSLPIKLLYSTMTLFLISLITAILSPWSTKTTALALVAGMILLSIVEVSIVAFVVYRSMVPITKRSQPPQRQRVIPDNAKG